VTGVATEVSIFERIQHQADVRQLRILNLIIAAMAIPAAILMRMNRVPLTSFVDRMRVLMTGRT
jgi:hypothetical protein